MRRVSTIVEILKSPEHSEGKPSEPPFAGGWLPPFPPAALIEHSNLKIITQIFQNITAAGRAAAVKKKAGHPFLLL